MKQEHMVGARLPGHLVKDLERIERLEQTERSTTIRKLLADAIQRWNLEYYARQYGQGTMSMARAAREAGVSLWVFQQYVRDRKVPVQYDREEFEQDLKTIFAGRA